MEKYRIFGSNDKDSTDSILLFSSGHLTLMTLNIKLKIYTSQFDFMPEVFKWAILCWGVVFYKLKRSVYDIIKKKSLKSQNNIQN